MYLFICSLVFLSDGENLARAVEPRKRRATCNSSNQKKDTDKKYDDDCGPRDGGGIRRCCCCRGSGGAARHRGAGHQVWPADINDRLNVPCLPYRCVSSLHHLYLDHDSRGGHETSDRSAADIVTSRNLPSA